MKRSASLLRRAIMPDELEEPPGDGRHILMEVNFG
jgi:hypothetical protein